MSEFEFTTCEPLSGENDNFANLKIEISARDSPIKIGRPCCPKRRQQVSDMAPAVYFLSRPVFVRWPGSGAGRDSSSQVLHCPEDQLAEGKNPTHDHTGSHWHSRYLTYGCRTKMSIAPY